MIYLKANVWNLIARLFMAMIILGLLYIFKLKIIIAHNHHEKTVVLLYIVAGCLLFILSACIATCFEITNLVFDTTAGIITLKGLLSRKVILFNDISGYYSTRYTTSFREFNGLILKMNNGKTYRLRQQNLKSIPVLLEYLKNKELSFLGDKG